MTGLIDRIRKSLEPVALIGGRFDIEVYEDLPHAFKGNKLTYPEWIERMHGATDALAHETYRKFQHIFTKALAKDVNGNPIAYNGEIPESLSNLVARLSYRTSAHEDANIGKYLALLIAFMGVRSDYMELSIRHLSGIMKMQTLSDNTSSEEYGSILLYLKIMENLHQKLQQFPFHSFDYIQLAIIGNLYEPIRRILYGLDSSD